MNAKELAESITVECSTKDEAAEKWNRRADMLEIGQKAENGWMSVRDKLPDSGGTYLVVREYAKPFEKGIALAHLFFFEDGPMWMDDKSNPISITHWMPLPAIPHENKEGK